jgi:hypothetical protein
MKSKNYRIFLVGFLWFQEEVFKVKKISHPGSGKRFIPDPDPGSRG